MGSDFDFEASVGMLPAIEINKSSGHTIIDFMIGLCNMQTDIRNEAKKTPKEVCECWKR